PSLCAPHPLRLPGSLGRLGPLEEASEACAPTATAPGACVAACPNGAANLFTAAKITHLNLLPQGQAERYSRAEDMVETMDSHFGSCTNHGECEAACPKEISIDVIALMNADYRKAKVQNRKQLSRT
ncbi:MAG: 4Fe-4S dicluster domain-containing protein, partial [Actinomycetota bacterium]|nr:4Fe-4S dicluster domain-containing protein [Actinomycetota bacterium]